MGVVSIILCCVVRLFLPPFFLDREIPPLRACCCVVVLLCCFSFLCSRQERRKILQEERCCLPTYIHTYLHTYILTYLPTHYLHTHLFPPTRALQCCCWNRWLTLLRPDYVPTSLSTPRALPAHAASTKKSPSNPITTIIRFANRVQCGMKSHYFCSEY